MSHPGLRSSDSPYEAAWRKRNQLDTARRFKRDEAMERLAALRDTDPAGYRQLNATMLLRLGQYLHDKEAAEAVNGDET